MSDSKPGSSRRTVLKGAAWTAPVVVLATAAPAAAVSGSANVAQTASGSVDQPAELLTTSIDFVNSNTGSTTASIVVRLSASAGQMGAADPISVSAGWVFVSATPVGNAAIREYTFSGTIPGASDATSTQASFLRFEVPVEPADSLPSAGSIRATTTVAAPGAMVSPNPATGPWGPVPL
jgi:hypothetical protein